MIEFRALGPAQLAGPEGSDTQALLARPKLLGLLAFLSVGATRGFQRRDSLIGCFWPELSQERARSAVRQSLYRLRLCLGEEIVVTRGDDEVGVSEAEFWADVTAFEEALAAGELASALKLYRGDLLDGFYVPDAPEFERWLDERRTELRQTASSAAWRLADQEAGLQHTASAGQWSRHARNLAPLDERLLRRVIKLLDRLGDRSGAVREYESFARRLADELELEPSPETKGLIESVRARSEAIQPDTPPPTLKIRESPVASVAASSFTATPERTLTRALADFYRIEKEIGVGGMATVYLAHDLRHDRDVAVKVMASELSGSLGVERFLREIQIAATLTHPHIVPVYDSGSADGQPYYVMPYVEGESLRDRMEREKQLPLDEALEIVREVTDALGYAHRQGVVHRDVKPENILLADGHASVADFGIGRAVKTAGGTRLTNTGMAVGTPKYMSPEQVTLSGEVDGRSDVYSLGCVLYEMLAGEPPFSGATAEIVARQHLTATPRPLADLRPTVPVHVSAAIVRALAKTPADRFSQATQFAQALVTTGPVAPQLQTRRKLMRLVALPAMVAVGVALAIQLYRLTVDRTPALDPNRVVVVPLENRTGDSTLALLGKLAADWITQGLQEIDVIDVVPTATGVEPGPDVAGLAGSGQSVTAQAAAATRAGTVVAGAYYRRGDSLEFQTQVIDATDGRLLRAVAPITGSAAASGAVLDSLRRRVVTTVAAALDHRLMRSTAASHPPSLEAYRAYLEGHRAFYQTGPMQMRDVLPHMYRAVALDSLFVDPRFFLVLAHGNLGERRAADSNAQLLLPFRPRFSPYQRAFLDQMIARLRGDRVGALRAARARGIVREVADEALYSNRPREAIEILSNVEDLPAFYFRWLTLMAALHMVGDYSDELIQARRARAAYPDRLLILGSELRALAALGRIDEVDRVLDESLLMPSQGEMDAGGLMLVAAAELRAHGNREGSIRLAERAREWFVSRPEGEAATIWSRMRLATALYMAGRWEDAGAMFEELSKMSPGDVNFPGFLGVLAARRGDRDEALRISSQLEGMADPYDFGRDVYWQACVAAQLGELDRAMVLLREAYARGRVFTPYLHRDLDLEPLHGYPPFEDFLKPRG